MVDRSPFQDHIIAPARYAVVTTPSDATLLQTTKALYVGGAGNVTVKMAGDGVNILFTAIPAGTVLPIAVTQVRATGTTATAIVALS